MMHIPLPRMPRWLDRGLDWINVPAYRCIRRIDLVVAIGFIGCVSYYAVVTGWQGAIVGGLLYMLLAMAALWIL